MNELSKSVPRRLSNPGYVGAYFVGDGIDIGGAPDPLAQYLEQFPLIRSVRTWDVREGDAQHMAGVADSRDWTCDPGKAWGRTDADGVMYQVSLTPIAKITDGTSQTLIVGEVVGSTGITDNFGFYWVTWNVLHTANGINLASKIEPQRWNSVDEGSFASFHPGGCHFVFCDGHASFLSEDIDKVTLASLTTRAGADIVPNAY